MGWLVLGLAGVTCGGKSTLASALTGWVEGLPDMAGSVRVVEADKYFRNKNDKRHVRTPSGEYVNWELNSSIDTARIFLDMEDVLNSPETKGASGKERHNMLIVDGHTVLNCPRVSSLCHLKYYFVLPREECFRRRGSRRYESGPDKPGYFETAVWPSYEAHRRGVEETCRDVKIIDGTLPVEEILDMVKRDIGNTELWK